MTQKRVSLPDVEIAYDEAGRGERPLLLIHGYTGFRQDFESQLPDLATLGRTLVPDLRGHGDSTNTGDPQTYTLRRLAQDVLGFLDALGVGRVDLLGHSMGGRVALELLVAQPERVASLVLMDTSARPMQFIPAEGFRAAWQIARSSGMAVLQKILRDRVEQDPLRTDADRRLEREWGERYWERQRRRLLAVDPEAYAALGRELLECESLETRLAEIACPTLVLVGDGDRDFRPEADRLAQRIPGARLVVVPDAGHSPQIEASAAWLQAVREHLVGVRSQPASA
jgi:2-succinyl-6-hydroxy-2,4-cyclohexadiene-1-carboxylate synthase